MNADNLMQGEFRIPDSSRISHTYTRNEGEQDDRKRPAAGFPEDVASCTAAVIWLLPRLLQRASIQIWANACSGWLSSDRYGSMPAVDGYRQLQSGMPLRPNSSALFYHWYVSDSRPLRLLCSWSWGAYGDHEQRTTSLLAAICGHDAHLLLPIKVPRRGFSGI